MAAMNVEMHSNRTEVNTAKWIHRQELIPAINFNNIKKIQDHWVWIWLNGYERRPQNFSSSLTLNGENSPRRFVTMEHIRLDAKLDMRAHASKIASTVVITIFDSQSLVSNLLSSTNKSSDIDVTAAELSSHCFCRCDSANLRQPIMSHQ